MTRATLLIGAAAIAASCLIGCAEPFGEFGGLGGSAPAGTKRPLGDVTYNAAMSASQKVLSQHFSLLPTRRKGVLKSRPKFVQAEASGIFKVTPTSRRKVATLHLTSRGDQMLAQLEIEVQQQGAGAFRSLGAEDEYSSAPHRTPAQEEAATTPEQNQLWRPAGRDRAMERKILSQIHRILHPVGSAKAPPAKAPPAKAPPAKAPPKAPPVKAPPEKAPPAKAPPVKAPPAKAPPKAPPVKAPPAKAPPAKAPPAKAPPAKAPPAKAPPAKAPPKAPPAKAPPAKAPPTTAPSKAPPAKAPPAKAEK